MFVNVNNITVQPVYVCLLSESLLSVFKGAILSQG